MQRDNAAHLPAAPDTNGPANDSRDTPLNRLLRKQSPAPETPAAKPQSAQNPTPEMPVSKPQVSAPESIVAKPLPAQISPADLLVSKLTGRQIPGHYTPAHKPLPARAPAPDPFDGKAIDVDYTPLEAPAGKPLGEDGTAVGKHDTTPAKPAAKPVDTQASVPAAPAAKPLATQQPMPEAPAAKPVTMQGPVLETSISQVLPKRESTPETPPAKLLATQESVPAAPAAEPLDTRGPVLETSINQVVPKREPTPEPPAAKPLVTHRSAPEAPAARMPETPDSALETSIDELLPKRESIPEAPVSKPLGAQRPAPTTAVGKLLPKRDAAPEAPVDRPLRKQGSALEKSAGKLLALPRRTRDEREFLPAALEIVDTPPSPVGRAVGFTIILVAIVAIAWGCIGKVDIVATASGRIVPQGKTKIVQPADTGIVTAIHVADGDHVKAGDILIELNSTQALADRDRFERDLLQANLNLARLRGLAATLPGTKWEGRKPNLVDPPKDAQPEDLALTLAAMRAQAANENAKLADLDQQIEAKQAEAAEAIAATEKLQASLPMVADQEKLLRAMRDQKIGSKLDWYQVNQQLIEQQHEIGVLSHRKDAAEAAQRALREQRAAEAAQYQMQVLADLDKMRTQASELEAELAKAAQRTRQSVLAAPIDGTVQQLAIHTIGGVVTPAESLLAIVPTEGSLIVEAAVQNRDVGFISAGQTVRVKVEAFSFTLYGLIDGQVIDVTRDAVSNPANDKKGGKAGDQNVGDPAASDGNSGPVYLARIALSQDWMMTENGKVDLTPGMAVTAEIQTGERRLISYLLSPLVRHVSESMHER